MLKIIDLAVEKKKERGKYHSNRVTAWARPYFFMQKYRGGGEFGPSKSQNHLRINFTTDRDGSGGGKKKLFPTARGTLVNLREEGAERYLGEEGAPGVLVIADRHKKALPQTRQPPPPEIFQGKGKGGSGIFSTRKGKY